MSDRLSNLDSRDAIVRILLLVVVLVVALVSYGILRTGSLAAVGVRAPQSYAETEYKGRYGYVRVGTG